MNKEIFKEVPNSLGLYDVGSLGTVRNNKSNQVLKQTLNGKYLSVGVKIGNDWKRIRTHQLIAMAFLNHKPNGHKIVVDHIDNNQLNNNLSNLQLISTYQNTIKNNKKGTSKHIGVSLIKNRSKRWRARTKFNGKQITIGYFSTELEASKAYKDKIKELSNGKTY
jgi:hypothetical protein